MGVGWRPRTGGPSGGRPRWRRGPCGPEAPTRRCPLLPPPASHAAMCARSGAVRARGRARPAGQSEPSAAAACPPPPRCALRPPRRRLQPPPPPLPPPWPGAVPTLRCGVLRSLALRLLPPPGAARAVQVTALPRKQEAERWAPGFPGPLPAPSAARAGPRTQDAPPRGTVRTAGRP
ncbi:basic proline-rich protein-like [Lontra canadensis]|uniref:basic proline-rich protein-like n=1 Tax=Lontra canadensis TaxID=76717 RepID=UPI0013F2CCF6|nr:basic proline-rich protein-like [Lontra canadensis]XP_032707655.1 basic proline-rich protein-like [Lontra canadensis]